MARPCSAPGFRVPWPAQTEAGTAMNAEYEAMFGADPLPGERD